MNKLGKTIVEEAKDKTLDLSSDTIENLRQKAISFILSHIQNAVGETGAWKPHSAMTLMTRKVKVAIGGHGGYGWDSSRVLPPSPTAYLRNETIEQMKTNTRVKVTKAKDGLKLTFTFWSNILSQDVSYRRSGITITDANLMHRGIDLGGGMISSDRALVIPILPGQKDRITQDAFDDYKSKHPGTKKTGFTDREAGIKEEGGAMFVFRNKMDAPGRFVDGRRGFIYFTNNEMQDLANSIWGK